MPAQDLDLARIADDDELPAAVDQMKAALPHPERESLTSHLASHVPDRASDDPAAANGLG